MRLTIDEGRPDVAYRAKDVYHIVGGKLSSQETPPPLRTAPGSGRAGVVPFPAKDLNTYDPKEAALSGTVHAQTNRIGGAANSN